jgi:3'-phosphoadenosine 5'-phosphosulfate sulfotransferase (PAPS reductase)/FAD synthetase
MIHVVALSGGKDSSAMALRLRELEPDTDFQYVCTPTGRELPEMEQHWAGLEQLLERPIIRLTNGTLDSWIRAWDALPNFRMRWCTRVLKVEPMIAWLLEHQPCTHYVGLRADEATREGVYGEVATFTRHPLREWGWALADVKAYLQARGVRIPARTDCDVCFFQRINEWKALLRRHPERYAEGEAYEALTGATFRTPGRDSWPVGLAALRAEIERQPTLIDTNDDRAEMCRACSL